MNKRPLVWVILDGFGINNFQNGNAPLLANMENLKNIHQNYPWTLLSASGKEAGLIEDAYGTCQNGHQILGSGRTVSSYLKVINDSINDKSFFQNKVLLDAIAEAKKRNKKYVHIIGLISKSPITGYEDDVFALCKLVSDNDLVPVVHAITDGKDVNKKSAIGYLSDLNNTLRSFNGILADICGRYYGLDASNHWSRTIKAWNVMTNHDGDSFNDFEAYVDQQYNLSTTDEFFVPKYNSKWEGTKISDDDVVISAPYRYSHQLIALILNKYEENYDAYIHRKNLYLVTLAPQKEIPEKAAFVLEEQVNTFGEVIDKAGLKQLRISETLRFNDVNYQFDGLRNLDLANENKVEIPSLKTQTFDINPEMSAWQITDYIINNLANYDVVIANYPNPDILGHTGNLDAAIKAMKIIDLCLGSLYNKVVNEANGCLAITSDHGNCEKMLDENDNVIPYHSMSKVPFILCERKIHLELEDATLSDVAPTLLKYLGLEIPKEMTGKNLIKPKNWFSNFTDSFKKKVINLEIKTATPQEINNILNENKAKVNSDAPNKYYDENDFSALEA